MADPHHPLVEHQHRDVQGGAARAAVFGVSDGLVSNVSLILGVAGASPAPGVVRLAGLAGLIAGAFSMGSGEYVSMKAQRELLLRELAIEEREIARHPDAERHELAAIYRERGITPDVAERLAAELHRDPGLALQAHARDELGIDPNQLGSPWLASVSSFAAFCVGAVIPLLPWFFASGNGATIASVILGGVAALVIGALLSRFTGRSLVRSAVRQLGIAALAASVTYAVGRLVGVKSAT